MTSARVRRLMLEAERAYEREDYVRCERCEKLIERIEIEEQVIHHMAVVVFDDGQPLHVVEGPPHFIYREEVVEIHQGESLEVGRWTVDFTKAGIIIIRHK